MKKLSEKKRAIFNCLIAQTIADVEFEKFGGVTATLSNGMKLIGDVDDFNGLFAKKPSISALQVIKEMLLNDYGIEINGTITDSKADKDFKTVKFMVNRSDLNHLEKKLKSIQSDLIKLYPNSKPRLSRYDRELPWTTNYAGLRVNLPKVKNQK